MTTGLVVYFKEPEQIVVEGGYISQVTIQLSLASLNPKVKVYIVFSLKVYRKLDLYVLENELCAYKLIIVYSWNCTFLVSAEIKSRASGIRQVLSHRAISPS